MNEKKVEPEILQKRWLRDFTCEQQVYVPETMAKPARMSEGFELRADGSYCEIGSGANDATVESEGTWHLDDDGLLTLSLKGTSGTERTIQIVEANHEKLIVEEQI